MNFGNWATLLDTTQIQKPKKDLHSNTEIVVDSKKIVLLLCRGALSKKEPDDLYQCNTSFKEIFHDR